MLFNRFGRLSLPGISGMIIWMGTQVSNSAEPVSFSREIRPLLAKHCGSCHGADEKARKGDLRLDTKEGLLAPGVVVAGAPDESELLARLLTKDEDEMMPPPEKGTALAQEEVELVRRWIAEGAKHEGHWAFQGVERPRLPEEGSREDGGAPWEAFIWRAQKRAGMAPADAAPAEVWLRRVTLDLTGLPPTLAEMDAFLAAEGRDGRKAREAVVDRLLAAPAYGERMANDWLDVARYADTYGRHEDADCVTWPYRDWVIKAFNENLPFDEFVLWQTAGDLLPNPTRDQRVATCFNRLPQQSNEAGSNPEEFRIDQVNDRVNTNATAFLGLTMECARCHDHKYDPMTMRDYYGLSAFFNNIEELGLFAVFTGGVPPPSLLLHEPEDERRLAEVRRKMEEIESSRAADEGAARKRFEDWLKTAQPPRVMAEKSVWERMRGWFEASPPPRVEGSKPEVRYEFDELANKELKNAGTAPEGGSVRLNAKLVEGKSGKALMLEGDNAVKVGGVPELHRHEAFSFGLWVRPESRMERAVLAHRSRSGVDAACRGFELILEGMRPSFALAHFSPGNEIRVRHKQEVPVGEWTHLACVYDGSSRAEGLKLFVNGERVEAEVVRDQLYKDIVYRTEWGDEADKDGVELALAVGGRFNDASFRDGLVDEFVFHRRELSEPEVRQMAGLPDESEAEEWFEWYLREVDEPWKLSQAALTELRKEENALNTKAVELMVMEERKGARRRTHVLERGQFNQPKEEVTPGTPAFLPPMPKDAPRNRLGLAKWLTARENPLTARVQVNRIWKLFFGSGLVETAEDFGVQGRMPEHPEVLDWLAAEFMEKGWNVKALCREIALSATYGQASMPKDPAWVGKDPGNRLLARGPRGRLGAEQVRDMALAAAGILNAAIGGPSVKPYQPAGLWVEAGTQHPYVQDHGEKLYRRSLYTFWRRTLPPANMTVFDAPTREFCEARRESTSTPMQALVLMNDVQFLEAARCLAAGLLSLPEEERGARAFRLLTSRRPGAAQAEKLTQYLRGERARFEAEREAARLFLAGTGESPLPPGADEAELAAATMMVRMLMGFSETTLKP